MVMVKKYIYKNNIIQTRASSEEANTPEAYWFWIKLIWTGLYTCDEEFFKWKEDKNTQDCQKLKFYEIQINSNIDQCFLKQFRCWSWRNGLDYSNIPFFVVHGKSHQGITQSCTRPSQPPQPCYPSGWAGGSAGWDYVTIFAELSSCC